MQNPHIGKLVTSLENDLGIGKIIDSNRETAVIEYFDSPASAERPMRKVAMSSVRRVKRLSEQIRVYFFDAKAGYWRIGRVHQHVDQAEIFIDLPNDGQARLSEGEIHVRWNRPLPDP